MNGLNKWENNIHKSQIGFTQTQGYKEMSYRQLSKKNFDICEISKRQELGLEQSLGITVQDTPVDPDLKLSYLGDISDFKYSVLTFKHFTGIASQCAKSNDPSALEQEYSKLKSELEDQSGKYLNILDDCFKNGILFYGNRLKCQAYKAEHAWIDQGKNSGYQSELSKLKDDLNNQGFGFGDSYNGGNTAFALIKNITYSFFKKYGFQIPSNSWFASFDGPTMSTNQMKFFLQKYTGTLFCNDC